MTASSPPCLYPLGPNLSLTQLPAHLLSKIQTLRSPNLISKLPSTQAAGAQMQQDKDRRTRETQAVGSHVLKAGTFRKRGRHRARTVMKRLTSPHPTRLQNQIQQPMTTTRVWGESDRFWGSGSWAGVLKCRQNGLRRRQLSCKITREPGSVGSPSFCLILLFHAFIYFFINISSKVLHYILYRQSFSPYN